MALIMVVDDDPAFRLLVSNLCRQQGWQVVEAADGEQAIKGLRQQQVELMVTDLLMPNKEGLELIREAKQTWPRLKIIACSGGAGPVDKDNCLHFAQGMGADLTFTKPLALSEFASAMRLLLE